MDLGIAGKTVLITGGSRGIGAAAAKAFADEGCHVTLVSRDEEKLRQLVEAIGGAGTTGHLGTHRYKVADLRQRGEPTRVARELLASVDRYDIVVHNVGGALGVKDPLAVVDQWNDVWFFNVGIAIEMNAVLVPPMRKHRWGRIIHVSSIAGAIGEPLVEPYGGSLPYASAKAYLNAYARGLGRELAQDQVVVSAVMPAAILTEGKYWDRLSKDNPDFVTRFLQEHHPTGRFGNVSEIAPFIVFLASEQASFASGALVPIDGGRM
jgi:NAD(P)-dependent dehydrogenase (short-subunit alcohol dehydrogenase family)